MQGTFCIPDGAGGCQQFLAPLANLLGWEDPDRNRCAVVDYLGSADSWLQEQSSGAISLGTTVTGTVKEHTLEDGRALITVRLVVSNALTYAVSGCDVLTGPLVFGNRPLDVLNGATPSLADATLVVKFIVLAPGLPLQDIVKLMFSPLPGELVTLIRFDGNSYGQLRSAFGVPDGTPGSLAIRDMYRLNPGRGTVFVKHRIDLSVQ